MTDKNAQPYRVLARKYRPQNFDELIGQEALVRTLKNAIETGRIAHAFMLTGIRGVGKTTTARIIARALNYKGPDGTAGPTINDTSDCPLCQAIAEDRHPDVIEMDAASRTGVDDVREILDSVRYAPTEARYKIYIIDEVHMLSKQAFNALLKTLEEPPPHVKFIFATTEIRKVPITVLSRCQRFDLRRIDHDQLVTHFKSICEKEEINATDDALALIAKGADGSVRDGLSLLDQAIALGGTELDAEQVRSMIGFADQTQTFSILEHIMGGKIAEALDNADALYRNGGDPLILIQDLLAATHTLTKSKATGLKPEGDLTLSNDQKTMIEKLTNNLSMPALGKAWQILLKGLEELKIAPDPKLAADMILIRLGYAAELPDPKLLIEKIQSGEGITASSAPPPRAPNGNGNGAHAQTQLRTVATNAVPQTRGNAAAAVAHHPQTEPEQTPEPTIYSAPETLEDIITLLRLAEEPRLASDIFHYAQLVNMKHGFIEINPLENAPRQMTQDLGKVLSAALNARWIVSISTQTGAPTLAATEAEAQRQHRENVLSHPASQNLMTLFPESSLLDILPPVTESDKS